MRREGGYVLYWRTAARRLDWNHGLEGDVFGTVRYMTSAGTRRKLRLDRYLERSGG